jgi:hypothetical protein
MNRKRIRLAAFGLVLCLALAGARANDIPKVDNPLFVAWSKFEPGAPSTVEGDLPARDGPKIHWSGTDTLKEKHADNVKVELVGQAGDQKDDPSIDTIPAKVAENAAIKKGEEDVKAMGRTFKCTVYEISAVAMGSDSDLKFTCCICNDVPGGVVKTVMHTPGGKDYTYVLTSMKEK